MISLGSMRCPGVSRDKAGTFVAYTPSLTSVPYVGPLLRFGPPVASPVCSSKMAASALGGNSDGARLPFLETSFVTVRPTVLGTVSSRSAS